MCMCTSLHRRTRPAHPTTSLRTCSAVWTLRTLQAVCPSSRSCYGHWRKPPRCAHQCVVPTTRGLLHSLSTGRLRASRLESVGSPSSVLPHAPPPQPPRSMLVCTPPPYLHLASHLQDVLELDREAPFPRFSAEAIAVRRDPGEILRVLEVLLAAAVQCDNKSQFIEQPFKARPVSFSQSSSICDAFFLSLLCL